MFLKNLFCISIMLFLKKTIGQAIHKAILYYQIVKNFQEAKHKASERIHALEETEQETSRAGVRASNPDYCLLRGNGRKTLVFFPASGIFAWLFTTAKFTP